MHIDNIFLDDLVKTAEVSTNKIIEYFTNNPKSSDKEFHSWATKNGYNEHKAEEAVYHLLGNLLSGGKSKGVNKNFPEDQISNGIKVELEHTSDKDVARKIVFDHLSENVNYYNYLDKMEKDMNS